MDKFYIKHQWILNIINLCCVDGSSAMGYCLGVLISLALFPILWLQVLVLIVFFVYLLLAMEKFD
jgi:hypothetical protein